MYYIEVAEKQIREQVEGKKINLFTIVDGCAIIRLEDNTLIEIRTDIPASLEIRASFVDKKG